MQIEKRRRFIVNVIFWAVILALVFLTFKYLLNLVMPFFLALIFAAVMRPLATWLSRSVRRDRSGAVIGKRLHLNSGAAGVVSVLLLFLVLAGVVAGVLVKVISSISDMVAMVPSFYTDSVEPYLAEWLGKLEQLAQGMDDEVVQVVEQMVPQILSAIGGAVTKFSGSAVSFMSTLVTRLPSFLVAAIICVIASVFISASYDEIKQFLKRQVPCSVGELLSHAKRSLKEVIGQYGRSYLLIMCITFLEIMVGLLLIGVSHPVAIAALIAIFDIFPIVGAGLILVSWAIICFLQGNILRGVCLLLLYVIVTVIRQIMEPKIVGKRVGLPPVVTLLCMYVGSKLFGALGLLGLPILMAILVNLDDTGVIHLFNKPGETAPEPDAIPPAPAAEAPVSER